MKKRTEIKNKNIANIGRFEFNAIPRKPKAEHPKESQKLSLRHFLSLRDVMYSFSFLIFFIILNDGTTNSVLRAPRT